MTFTDANGTRWARSSTGKLSQAVHGLPGGEQSRLVACQP